ncbi:MAG TPA: GAF domain-containing sensor histidine kinase [Gemmatimonadaceae bacterium]
MQDESDPRGELPARAGRQDASRVAGLPPNAARPPAIHDAEIPLPGGREPARPPDDPPSHAPAAGDWQRIAAAHARTRDRLDRLLRATEALCTAATLREVVDVMLSHAIAALGASGGRVCVLSEDGAWLRVLHEVGDLAVDADRRRRVRVDGALPASEVARTGEPVFIDSPGAWRARYPDDRDRLADAGGAALAVLPLVVQQRVIGTFGMTFADARALAGEDREFMSALARHCAQAVWRARLHDASLEASRAKSEFLAVMSHELRTPLTAILGHEELLSEEIFGPLTPAQREHLARIRASGEHLLLLIEAVLHLSPIQAGRDPVRAERCFVDEVVDDALRAIRPVARAKGLEVVHRVAEPPIRLRTDPAKLRQIVINLAGNAAKFTTHGRIVVETRAEPERVLIEVSDTGIGIRAEHLPRVFDTFWQVDQGLTRPSSGIGIGLAVARELARLLGGDVSVRSRAGQGSTFTAWVPHGRGAGRKARSARGPGSARGVRLADGGGAGTDGGAGGT